MKKLFATFLIVPVLGLFILSGNVFSKACDGNKDGQKYLRIAQMNQPAPQSPQQSTTPNKPSPKMQNNKPGQNSDLPGEMKKQKPDIMKKNKSGEPCQNGDMPGKMKKQ